MAVQSKKPKSRGMDIMADRISGIPDDLLSDILSFLELGEAVKTSVLSKRWEKVWTLIHRIRLDNKSCLHDRFSSREVVEKRRRSFNNFVDRVLTGNSKLSVTSFSLSYVFGFNLSREIMYLKKWIAAVVTPKLQEFDFLIRDGSMVLSINLLPPTLFECPKLEILRLSCKFSITDICLKVPEIVCLSRLAKLHLASVQFEDENSLKNLLSGCPVLEELVMQNIKLLAKDNKSQNLFVFSPSLKLLRVHMYGEVCFAGFCYYVVEAPKLEYLDLMQYPCLLGFSMSSSPSLVSAEIHISTSLSNPSTLSVVKLFQGISNIQNLELSTNNITLSEDEIAKIPEFSNLIHLKIGNCSRNRSVVNCILQKSPNLKHLVFSEDHVDSPSFMWSQPDSVPKCLVLHLETIEISVRFNIEDAMKIIEYFLDKGKVLKKMAIATSFSNEKDFDSRLMGFRRASVECQIVVSILPGMSDYFSDYYD